MEDSTVEQDFETLPVVSFKDEILAAVKNNQIVIIIGETGSGKTTQIPQFFADENLLGGKQMAVTQPRRIAAITVAERVSNERKSKVGEEIGYAVRFDDKTSAKTKVKYMTDGILVRECLSDKALSNYNVIMLDEAHERSLNTDILFGLLKGACALRPDLRLIVTSATLNTDKFGPYFLGCPIIHVPGRVFPVDIYHSKTKQVMTASGPSNSSYVQAAVDVVLKIHKKDEDGHILVFLTGQEEIERACSLLRTALAAESSPDRELIVLPLYAALTSEQQARVFKNPKFLLPRGTVDDGKKLLRKCVIATNIAETSITVPQVRFVVDAGYVKQKAYDPNRGMESLVVVPSSKVG
jgi:ATP-dependent RNA helicase DHX8/PRP22